MTQQEKEIIEKLGHVAIDIFNLPEVHPSDNKEAEFHIHALQNIILARQAYVNYIKKEG